MRICKICNQPLKKNRKSLTCKSCEKKKNKERVREFIFQMVGPKCWICGYEKPHYAKYLLSFHHIKNKEFPINLASSINNIPVNKILKEIMKSILVCHNCHAEIHNTPLLSNKKIQSIYNKKWKEIIKRFPNLSNL